MIGILAFFWVLGAAQASPPNQFEILQHVKLNVTAQLAIASNYTCVQTVERKYYQVRNACMPNASHGKPREYMRDQLRLDVAVSEGSEIYSLHGESRFTSNNIDDVIPEGPRTSGEFVSFLRNIFTTPGVQFSFLGTSEENGKSVYRFSYLVQLLRSKYYLVGRAYSGFVPYHGEFSVDSGTYNLLRLTIVADDVPISAGMCRVDTDMEYQIISISGHEALLPASYVLKLESDRDLYTVSSNQYTQCHEFRGESTLHFTAIDPGTSVTRPPVVDERLPAGLIIKATLEGSIGDKDSYTGDAVQAILAEPITIPASGRVIPKGATLHGLISEMERHSEDLDFWLFAIKFQRLEAGRDSYLMDAVPLPGYGAADVRFSGRIMRGEEARASRLGLWFMDGEHFKTAKHFTRYWRTRPISAAKPESAAVTR
jgi:hypothetical protein